MVNFNTDDIPLRDTLQHSSPDLRNLEQCFVTRDGLGP